MKFALLFFALPFFQCKNAPTMPRENLKIHAFRLKPGQDLKKEIADFAKKESIGAGWVMACVGSLTAVNLRFANQPTGAKMTGHFEIVSLTGTISPDGLHLHMSVADSLGRVTGGHLLDENLVYTTAELVIGESRPQYRSDHFRPLAFFFLKTNRPSNPTGVFTFAFPTKYLFCCSEIHVKKNKIAQR